MSDKLLESIYNPSELLSKLNKGNVVLVEINTHANKDCLYKYGEVDRITKARGEIVLVDGSRFDKNGREMDRSYTYTKTLHSLQEKGINTKYRRSKRINLLKMRFEAFLNEKITEMSVKQGQVKVDVLMKEFEEFSEQIKEDLNNIKKEY